MLVLVTSLLGGIGLFLLGMVLLTDGLKSMAGDALRRVLVQFTGRPFKAFVSGAVATLIVQSSSATTVTVIGLVSAGLLTFPQAVGVVLGASLGTTGTSWIIATAGLKFSIGFYALPLIGVGALLRLLGRGRSEGIGLALAGFGLIFVGIDTLQQGMAGLPDVVNVRTALPSSGLWGHLLMLLIGVAMTVVMQSSSAAVATILTALNGQVVDFEQASSLTIGASIGTTVTSSLAAIGASVPAQRTALAHVLFNLATGLIALVLLPLFLWGIGVAQRRLDLAAGPISLAAFHSAFILFGVAMVLPFATQFAAWIERLLPDRGSTLTRRLDSAVLDVPPVALEASRRTLTDIACKLFDAMRSYLWGRTTGVDGIVASQLRQAIEETQHFLARIPPLPAGAPMAHSRVAQMHAVDHLVQLLADLRTFSAWQDFESNERLYPLLRRTRELLELALAGLQEQRPPDWLEQVEAKSRKTADLRRSERLDILEQTAMYAWAPERTLETLDAIRWLDRIGYHTWRICKYLSSSDDEPSATAAESAELEPPDEDSPAGREGP